MVSPNRSNSILNPPPLPFPILQIWSWLSWINKLLKYVKGSYPCPEQYLRDKDDNITLTINPNYETWMEQDSLVSQWINVTLTPQVLQRVVGLQTSHDVWLDLNDFILFIPVLKSVNKTTISNNKKGKTFNHWITWQDEKQCRCPRSIWAPSFTLWFVKSNS